LVQRLRWAAFIAFSSLGAIACGAPLTGAEGAKSERPAEVSRGERALEKTVPVNQRFRNLDEYLAHLERTQAPIDRPWYREIRPGVYQLMTGNLRILPVDGADDKEKRIFTRDELERKFGFSK
jgi:hypothetical protein